MLINIVQLSSSKKNKLAVGTNKISKDCWVMLIWFISNRIYWKKQRDCL